MYIALETEVGAKTDHEDNPYSANRGRNDIFIISCTLDGQDIEVKQITKSKHIEEVNPKIGVHDDKLLLIFTEVKYSRLGEPATFEDKYVYLGERLNRESKLESFSSVYALEHKEHYKMPDSPINRDGSEITHLSNGKAVWVRLMKNTRQLEVILFD